MLANKQRETEELPINIKKNKKLARDAGWDSTTSKRTARRFDLKISYDSVFATLDLSLT